MVEATEDRIEDKLTNKRRHSKVLEALSDYEVNQLYVCSESLASRGIVLSDLMPVQPLDLAAQRTLIATQDAVIGAAL